MEQNPALRSEGMEWVYNKAMEAPNREEINDGSEQSSPGTAK